MKTPMKHIPGALFAVLALSAGAVLSCSPFQAAVASVSGSAVPLRNAFVRFTFGGTSRSLGNGSTVVSLQILAKAAGQADQIFVLPYDAASGTVDQRSFLITAGSWSFSATAFDKKGEALYSGSATAEIGEGQNVVSIDLFEILPAKKPAYRLDLTFGHNLSSKQFSTPNSVAYSPQAGGSIYLGDVDNHWIVILNGDVSYRESIGESNDWFFNSAEQIAAAPDGALWVADRPNNEIDKVWKDGTGKWQKTSRGSYGSKPGEFKSPMGIAVSASGDVFVADTENGRVQVFDPGFAFIRQWSLGEGSRPIAIAAWTDDQADVDPSNDVPYVYVLDAGNGGRILKYDVTGVQAAEGPVTGTGGSKASPYSLAVDRWGRVYVTECDMGSEVPFGIIRVYDKDLGYLFSYDNPGSGAGQLDEPRGITAAWTDPDGTGPLGEMPVVIVADAMNHRFQGLLVDAANQKMSLLGSYGSTPPAEDRFVEPLAVRFDAAGDAFILDRLMHRLKKYDPAGRFLAEYGIRNPGRLGCPMDLGIREFGGSELLFIIDGDITMYGIDGTFQDRYNFPPHDSHPMADWFWNSIAFGADGAMYVTLQDVIGVVKLTGTGIPSSTWTPVWTSRGDPTDSTLTPSAIAANPASGEILVADSKNNRIVRLDPDTGAFLGSWGSEGSGAGQFAWPDRLAVDASGKVYVCDSKNRRIQVLEKDGAFLCFIGTRELVSEPQGVGVLPDGSEIWVTARRAPYIYRFYRND